MNKRHLGAEHTVLPVCADFMARQNHGLVFGGRHEKPVRRAEAAAPPLP